MAWGVSRQGLGSTIFNAGRPRRIQPWSGTQRGLGNRIFAAGQQQAIPHPQQPRLPGVPQPQPVRNPIASEPSGLDASYWNTVNQNRFNANQQLNALNAQSGYDRTDLQERLRLLSQQEPVVEQRATNSANSRGLLYSGALGSQIGDLQTQYLRNQSQAQQAFARAEAQRQAQAQSIQGGLGFDELAARLASIQRASDQAAKSPLVGASPAGSSQGVPATHITVKAHTRAKPGQSGQRLGQGRKGLGSRIYNAGKRAR